MPRLFVWLCIPLLIVTVVCFGVSLSLPPFHDVEAYQAAREAFGSRIGAVGEWREIWSEHTTAKFQLENVAGATLIWGLALFGFQAWVRRGKPLLRKWWHPLGALLIGVALTGAWLFDLWLDIRRDAFPEGALTFYGFAFAPYIGLLAVLYAGIHSLGLYRLASGPRHLSDPIVNGLNVWFCLQVAFCLLYIVAVTVLLNFAYLVPGFLALYLFLSLVQTKADTTTPQTDQVREPAYAAD